MSYEYTIGDQILRPSPRAKLEKFIAEVRKDVALAGVTTIDRIDRCSAAFLSFDSHAISALDIRAGRAGATTTITEDRRKIVVRFRR